MTAHHFAVPSTGTDLAAAERDTLPPPAGFFSPRRTPRGVAADEPEATP